MKKASIHGIYFIIIMFLIAYVGKTTNDCKQIVNSSIEEVEFLEKQIDDLQTENNIFTSMLGEIENEPGGHEILKKLWNEHK